MEQVGGGFGAGVLGAPGGGQFPFDGGFQDGGAITLEIGLGSLQRRHPRVQVREQLFNLRHDAPLFS